MATKRWVIFLWSVSICVWFQKWIKALGPHRPDRLDGTMAEGTNQECPSDADSANRDKSLKLLLEAGSQQISNE